MQDKAHFQRNSQFLDFSLSEIVEVLLFVVLVSSLEFHTKSNTANPNSNAFTCCVEETVRVIHVDPDNYV